MVDYVLINPFQVENSISWNCILYIPNLLDTVASQDALFILQLPS